MELEKEKDMYPAVSKWLERTLKNKYRRADIWVFDTSRIVLSKFLVENGYHVLFNEYQTFEIQVDVTGIIKRENKADLVFVECKRKEISLRDLSQLIGYSKVALPAHSIILSPKGVSKSLSLLFNVWRRYDVLYYAKNKYILIGRWDVDRKELDPSSIIPRGSSI